MQRIVVVFEPIVLQAGKEDRYRRIFRQIQSLELVTKSQVRINRAYARKYLLLKGVVLLPEGVTDLVLAELTHTPMLVLIYKGNDAYTNAKLLQNVLSGVFLSTNEEQYRALIELFSLNSYV